MLHSIPENEIQGLSLEMIIYYMFADYPEIIDGYNNEMVAILRDVDNLEPINDLKEKLIGVNETLLSEGHSETENEFIESMREISESFRTEGELMDRENRMKERIGNLKNKEILEKEEELEIANNIINNF
ncbi:MAG: hypothetical protein PHZ26_05405 [Candidatus Gracilibacteria bacterium]|nr:hypothetical protein [Candidatus Gracilibacteria bacterium]MDD2909152.1 hypothetical protein [Candidatus Gracilibacteria bacterium]